MAKGDAATAIVREVMQRIAVPMIGGMTSSTLLTLIVIPVVYGLDKGWRLPVVQTAAGTVRERSTDDLKLAAE